MATHFLLGLSLARSTFVIGVFCPRVDDTTAPDNYNTTTPTFCYEKLFDELEVMGFSGTLMWSGYGEPLLAKISQKFYRWWEDASELK